MLENSNRTAKAENSSNRSFGIVFTVVFIVIGLYPLLKGDPMRFWSLYTAGAILLVSIIYPDILAIPNRLWGYVGLVLHKITNPLIMGIIFFLLITPIAFLMRIFSSIPLKLKFEQESKSYWVERDNTISPAAGFKNQF